MNLRLIQKDVNKRGLADFLSEIPAKTDIVCFGELATTGCLYNGASEGVVKPVNEIIESFGERGHALMFGTPRAHNGSLHNSYIYYDGHDSDEPHIYDKVNLFEPMNETSVFKAGQKIEPFDTRFGKIGTVICYDLRFPEMFEKLADQGVRVVFVPAAWPIVRINDWKELLAKRALDNRLFIVGINAVGDDGTHVFGGSTMVVNPRGEIMVQADELSETYIEVSI